MARGWGGNAREGFYSFTVWWVVSRDSPLLISPNNEDNYICVLADKTSSTSIYYSGIREYPRLLHELKSKLYTV